jgi:hypothetical protein
MVPTCHPGRLRQRQEDLEFKTSLGYIERPVSKQKQKPPKES